MLGEKVRRLPWYVAEIWPKVKVMEVECRLKSDENEALWPKSKVITFLGVLRKNDQN